MRTNCNVLYPSAKSSYWTFKSCLLIAVMALMIIDWLSDAFGGLRQRTHRYEEALPSQRLKAGVYLTRQIIEAHGGTILAGNRIPQGALFGFRLPVVPASNP